MDSRNVADKYKGWMEDLIREDLNRKSFDYAVCFENWIGDFNMSTGIRNANGFGAREVFYCGKRKWDRRGAVGTHNYTSVNFLENDEQIQALKSKYTFVGIDNVPGAVNIDDYVWNRSSIMIFGEEGTGLTPEMQKECSAIVSIPMYGSVRSFNCGTSSGIVMFDYITKLQGNCGHSRSQIVDQVCTYCNKSFVHYTEK